DEVPLKEALIIGCGLGLCILTINLWRFAGMKRRGWDGAVVKKMEKKRYKRDDDGSSQSYTEYIVLIRTDGGTKKRIVERKRDREMYDYLDIGDRVRYHPALETYEKYDKSKDEAIYCNVCRQRNPISNDRCELCNNLLFK
ncbi:MAG: zinc ribbon domain-containing protein, partial [Bacillota bacterium]|nr:zinc ribbon domain-containing protein [Bacillota bacterium]